MSNRTKTERLETDGYVRGDNVSRNLRRVIRYDARDVWWCGFAGEGRCARPTILNWMLDEPANPTPDEIARIDARAVQTDAGNLSGYRGKFPKDPSIKKPKRLVKSKQLVVGRHVRGKLKCTHIIRRIMAVDRANDRVDWVDGTRRGHCTVESFYHWMSPYEPKVTIAEGDVIDAYLRVEAGQTNTPTPPQEAAKPPEALAHAYTNLEGWAAEFVAKIDDHAYGQLLAALEKSERVIPSDG